MKTSTRLTTPAMMGDTFNQTTKSTLIKITMRDTPMTTNITGITITLTKQITISIKMRALMIIILMRKIMIPNLSQGSPSNQLLKIMAS